jgi:hypothetical protein
MLVVVTRPLPAESRLRVPKAVSVVYVQRSDGWNMYPAEAPTLGDSIRLLPGTDADEALFAWPSAEPSRFRWFPRAYVLQNITGGYVAAAVMLRSGQKPWRDAGQRPS